LTIRMKNNETLSKYYHRIFKLWQKIKISVENRIETFLIIMKSEISISLIGREYTNLKKILKMTRRIEIKRKDVAHSFSRDDDDKIEKVDNNTNRNQSQINAESTFSSFSNVRQKNKIIVSARYIEDHLYDKFESVNKKLDDWVSEWFDEERYSSKLQSKNRKQMIKQRRCWSCRESKHRDDDSICINHDQKKRTNKVVVVFESSDSESNSEKEYFLIIVAIRNAL
jgi:hypothetical protein